MVNSENIVKIFKTMSYPEGIQDLSVANDWLRALHTIEQYKVNESDGTVDITNSENVEKMIRHVSRTKVHFPPNERASFLLRFSNEIQKNSSAISQIEAKVRGILAKDTQSQAIQFLSESLLYYSSYAAKPAPKEENTELEDVAVHIYGDETFLGMLGPTLGASIASGHRAILQTGPKITAVVAFIINLARDNGCPEKVFEIIPGNIDVKEFLKHDSINVISCIDNFFQKKFSEMYIPIDKIFLAMSTNFRAPMIIFSDADLDSACERVIEAAWSYQGLLPWSVNHVIVQESVWDTFVKKLKTRVRKIKLGESHENSVDIAFLRDNRGIDEAVSEAEKIGLEVFKCNPNSSKFQPTLIIGGKVFSNRVILEEKCAPVVNVFSFRSANEGVALANNSRQGLAASIWTENINLAEEVAEKLTVTNVWINTHGNLSAVSPLSFYKMSGVGYFGSKEGYLEYTVRPCDTSNSAEKDVLKSNLQNLLNNLKKSQESWKRMNYLQRYQHLLKGYQDLGKKHPEQYSVIREQLLYESLQHIKNSFATNQEDNYSIKSVKEPQGVILIEVCKENADYVGKTIVASLLQGNSVLILYVKGDGIHFENLAEIWSGAVPLVSCYANKMYNDLVLDAALHKEVNAVAVTNTFEIENVFKIRDMKKILRISPLWEVAFDQTSVTKNIWCTKKQSF